MWLSKTIALRQRAERESTAADMGVTTIGGGSASVMTKGEQRELEVFAPGGLVWQPQAGDTVLVVKGGTGCQEQCLVAASRRSRAGRAGPGRAVSVFLRRSLPLSARRRKYRRHGRRICGGRLGI